MKAGAPAILIQARLGSTRLPGKVLNNISGRPMISHVIERCKKVSNAGAVVVVTTAEAQDDPLADYLKDEQIDFYRGSEHDVLDRYYQAAKKYGADTIVRITSDCPLIDPEVTGKVLSFFLENKEPLDYVNNFFTRTYPRGLDTEIFSMEALGRAWREAKKPHEREHVTPYFYEQTGRFRIGSVSNEINYSSMRWTVDESRDLEFVRAVYERLYKPGKIFSWKETIALVESEPPLALINKDVEQKKLPTS